MSSTGRDRGPDRQVMKHRSHLQGLGPTCNLRGPFERLKDSGLGVGFG